MKIDQILGTLQSIVWQLDSSDVSGAKNDLNTLISELENGGYDVDVDEGGPFITPKSDNGSPIMGGDTGVDADFTPGPNHRPIIENEADWLDYMADELAAEKYVEMGYENGVESEVYA